MLPVVVFVKFRTHIAASPPPRLMRSGDAMGWTWPGQHFILEATPTTRNEMYRPCELLFENMLVVRVRHIPDRVQSELMHPMVNTVAKK